MKVLYRCYEPVDTLYGKYPRSWGVVIAITWKSLQF